MVSKHSRVIRDPDPGSSDRAALHHALSRDGVGASFGGRMIQARCGNDSHRGIAAAHSVHEPDYTVICGVNDRSRVLLRLSQREGSFGRMNSYTNCAKGAGSKAK